jgi:GR25 family glycosyltransferase involved in LPS biosynthesis
MFKVFCAVIICFAFSNLGGAQHVMLEQCAVQIDEMQGAADRRAPEADDPAAGRRCRATQQIGYLHEQCSALHVKDHPNQHAGIEKYFKKAENKTEINSIAGIDYIYMINLDQRPEKYEQSMAALKPFGITPYRFSAVNGWKLSFEALDELGIVFQTGMPNGPIASVYRHEEGKEYISYEIMKEVGVAYYCHSLSRGAMGCLLSHLSILQDAYDSGYNAIWIIEDDIRVVSNPHELSFFINTLNNYAPEWDILFTDNEIKGANGQPIPCAVIRPRPLVTLQPLDYYLRRTPINSELTKIGMRFGSASMIINRSGIKKLLEYFKTYKIYFPYDIDYFLVPGINLYMCNRDIVTNISGGISDNGQPAYLEKDKK